MEIAATGLPGLGVQPGGTTTGDAGAFAAVLGTLGGAQAPAGKPALPAVALPATPVTGAKTPLLASAATVPAPAVDAEGLVVAPDAVLPVSDEVSPDLAAADNAAPSTSIAAPELAIVAPKGGPKVSNKAIEGDPAAGLVAVPAVTGEDAAQPVVSAEPAIEVVAEPAEMAAAPETSEEVQAEPGAEVSVMAQSPVVESPKPQVAAAPALPKAATADGGKADTIQTVDQRAHPAVAEAGAQMTTADEQAEPAGEAFARMVPSAAPERAQVQPGANAPLPNQAPAQQFAASLPAAPEPATPAEAHSTMSFRADKVAREMGLEIARQVTAGGSELVIRLDPAELGRINIRMSMNEQGQLRAVVAADAPSVIEAIRNDIPELSRALEQAGVRTDSQSFRFDRGGGDAGGQWQQRYQQQQQGNARHGEAGAFAGLEDEPVYRPMALNGRINMMA